jgi:nucleotide-binding universal stress UspA family protein
VLFQAVVPNAVAGLAPPDALIDPGVLDAQREVAREMLEAAATRFAVRGIPVRTAVAVTAEPAPGIVEAARAADAHLVVMCTRGRGGIKRLALGSTAAAVVRAAPVPVLLLAPD